MELEKIILNDVTQTQNDVHGIYSLISRYLLAFTCRYHVILHRPKEAKQEGKPKEGSLHLTRMKEIVIRGSWCEGTGSEGCGEGDWGFRIIVVLSYIFLMTKDFESFFKSFSTIQNSSFENSV
jgi:hypothetical protein